MKKNVELFFEKRIVFLKQCALFNNNLKQCEIVLNCFKLWGTRNCFPQFKTLRFRVKNRPLAVHFGDLKEFKNNCKKVNNLKQLRIAGNCFKLLFVRIVFKLLSAWVISQFEFSWANAHCFVTIWRDKLFFPQFKTLCFRVRNGPLAAHLKKLF